MADTASFQDKSPSRRALVISFGPFSGFQRKNGRLYLGWIAFSTIPSNVEDQLKQAGDRITILKAEIGRVTSENERLQALMERVSSGVR